MGSFCVNDAIRRKGLPIANRSKRSFSFSSEKECDKSFSKGNRPSGIKK